MNQLDTQFCARLLDLVVSCTLEEGWGNVRRACTKIGKGHSPSESGGPSSRVRLLAYWRTHPRGRVCTCNLPGESNLWEGASLPLSSACTGYKHLELLGLRWICYRHFSLALPALGLETGLVLAKEQEPFDFLWEHLLNFTCSSEWGRCEWGFGL